MAENFSKLVSKGKRFWLYSFQVMSAWHDRVGDLTLLEALTGGAFDRQNCNIAGNLTKIFQKSQMPGGLPVGGMGGFGIDRYITHRPSRVQTYETYIWLDVHYGNFFCPPES